MMGLEEAEQEQLHPGIPCTLGSRFRQGFFWVPAPPARPARRSPLLSPLALGGLRGDEPRWG